jgi:hypothetical protein
MDDKIIGTTKDTNRHERGEREKKLKAKIGAKGKWRKSGN